MMTAYIAEDVADEQIIDAIPVHVTGGAYGVARVVIRIGAREYEAPTAIATACREQVREREDRWEPLGTAEHDVALAGSGKPARIASLSADEQVIDTIPV